MKVKKILIVCKGNIYRSPVAKIFLEREIEKRGFKGKIVCDSAGIQGSMGLPGPKFSNFTCYEKEYEAAKPTLEKYNLDLSKHISKPITQNMISEADIVLVMDDKVLNDIQEGLLTHFPNDTGKILLLSELTGDNTEIQDPDGVTTDEKYATITEKINIHITKGFDNILKILKLN